MMAEAVLLETNGITKSLPGTVALGEMGFTLRKGGMNKTVVENCAGKSILMKILSGAFTKTSGSILFERREIKLHAIEDASRLGIGMICQELQNSAKLSVAQNKFFGRWLHGQRFPLRRRTRAFGGRSVEI